MKKSNKFNLKKAIGKRNIMLSIVALILIMLTLVSVSYSWIEEVSNVELNTNRSDAEQTPLHIGDKVLKSDMVMDKQTASTVSINLGDYFNESGDMHLSGCYSDGVNFKFPKSGVMDSDPSGYRDGTKDDANTNYISATFKLKSKDAPTSYWFSKYSSNEWFTTKTGSASAVSTYKKYLRMSFSVGGTTTVYSFDDDDSSSASYGKYKTAFNTYAKDDNNNDISHPVREYMHYTETFKNSDPVGYFKNSSNKASAGKYNQGVEDNLNGNTVFSIGKNKTETVTVKIWLECNSAVNTVDLSNINIQLDSTWKYNRRIYVRDSTIDSTQNWLKKDSARLYWAVKNNQGNWVELTEITDYSDGTDGSSGSKVYRVDIPAVYNGAECALCRCNGSFAAPGSSNCWNSWVTTFPNTYHSETYIVYSSLYGTWNINGAQAVFFADSCNFKNRGTSDTTSPNVYLWAKKYEYGQGGLENRLVKNAEWPGTKMTEVGWDTGNNNKNLPIYAFFYESDYDRAIFNDGRSNWSDNNTEHQTQNLHNYWTNNNVNKSWADGGGMYFDMATLDWYPSVNKLPKYTDHYIECNFPGGGNYSNLRFAYHSGTTESATGKTFLNDTYTQDSNHPNDANEVCRMFVKYGNGSGNHYLFKIKAGDKTYGCGKSSENHSDGQFVLEPGHTFTLKTSDDKQAGIYLPKGTNNRDNIIYSLYLKGFKNNGNEVDVYLAANPELPAED